MTRVLDQVSLHGYITDSMTSSISIICAWVFFSPPPPQVPWRWHSEGLIASVHTVSFHDSWETWSLENSHFYSKRYASLLSAPERSSLTSLRAACYRHNPKKWPGISQGSQGLVFLAQCYSVSRSVVPNSLRPHGLQPVRLLCLWDFPGKDTGVVCHFLLQCSYHTQQEVRDTWRTVCLNILLLFHICVDLPTGLP